MVAGAVEVALRGAIHVVPWLMLLGIAVSVWRDRRWQLLVYSGLLVVLVTKWVARSYEATGLVTPRSIAQSLAVPLVAALTTWAGLAAAERWSRWRRPVLLASLGALTSGWLLFKFPALRGSVARLTAGSVLGIENVAILGLSYTVLKLAHLLLDALAAKPVRVRPLTLAAMVAFPATYGQGPIHRYEEFAEGFEPPRGVAQRDWNEAVRRVVWGTFQATVVAPWLGSFALPVLEAPGLHSAGAIWLAMYAYAFFIYFDFAGLSDIAIGYGAAFGIPVPENFRRPYLKLDLQQFWQSWHMSFTRWLQAYVFMPLSRRLMKTSLRKRPRLIMGTAYLATFVFCGLWHGEGAHFLAWGAYHGIGLFAYTALPMRLRAPAAGNAAAAPARAALWWLATFHFVCFGWILFACPLAQAMGAFARMFSLP